MSVRTMARVWDLSNQRGNDLLMLLAIADFADDDGNAYPSVQTLATKCRMKPRNANLILAALRASGELEVRQNEGPHGTNRYRVVLPGLPLQVSTRMQKSTGMQKLTRTPVETYPKPLQVSTDEPSVNHQEPPVKPSAMPKAISASKSEKKKSSPISLPTWLNDCEASGVDPIPEDDPVFEFAESAGISLDLISLAWSEFKVRHGDGSKRQKDWRATFRNAVRGNWFKIWFVGNDGLVQLSSQGRTLQMVRSGAA